MLNLLQLIDIIINVKYNEEQYVIEGLPEKVDVTLIGSKADLYIAKQSVNSGVMIDLTGLTPGTHKVNIAYEQGLSGIEYSVNPSIATVIIYKKVSDTRDIKSNKKSGKSETPGQISLFGAENTDYTEIIEALKSIDISQMTPMSAMNKLFELQEMLKNV